MKSRWPARYTATGPESGSKLAGAADVSPAWEQPAITGVSTLCRGQSKPATDYRPAEERQRPGVLAGGDLLAGG